MSDTLVFMITKNAIPISRAWLNGVVHKAWGEGESHIGKPTVWMSQVSMAIVVRGSGEGLGGAPYFDMQI